MHIKYTAEKAICLWRNRRYGNKWSYLYSIVEIPLAISLLVFGSKILLSEVSLGKFPRCCGTMCMFLYRFFNMCKELDLKQAVEH